MSDRTSNISSIPYSDETPDIILPLIFLIIIVLFLGWMLYLLIASGFQSTNPADPVTSDNRVTRTFTCVPGQCATDLQSGFKSCPVDNITPLVINPSSQVCNSRFLCDNLLTPYAVQSDGSTNINGACELDTECPCLAISQCPDYILSIFTTSNGNPYQSLAGQRVTFPQESTYVTITGTQTDQPPIQFNNPAITFCAAPISWLPLSNPGCNFVSTANNNSMSYADVLLCMGMVNGCSGLRGSPCLQGTLAIISNNPDTLTQADITTAQLACVRGEACPCNQAAIFDTNFGGVICRALPPN